MPFFQDRILPCCLSLAMRNRVFLPYRRRVIASADGRVLEIGIGSGLNLAFYPDRVSEVIGLEPSVKLSEMARKKAAGSRMRLVLQTGSAEAMPFESGSFDTVVTTWTLCSIPDANAALGEIRRVLKPSGQFLFAEHGLAPDAGVQKWQNRLTPAWKIMAGGCHMNRPVDSMIAGSGFELQHLETGYARGPRPLTYMYEGRGRIGRNRRSEVSSANPDKISS